MKTDAVVCALLALGLVGACSSRIDTTVTFGDDDDSFVGDDDDGFVLDDDDDDDTKNPPVDMDGDGFPEDNDCDDTNPGVNPGVDEICDDGIDNNCDGEIDPDDCTCVVVPNGEETLLLCPDPATWPGARQLCVEEGGDLVSIRSEEEELQIRALAVAQIEGSPWWIGLRRVPGDNFAWIDGSPFGYENWGASQPDNEVGNEDCVDTNRFFPEGGWSDQTCTQMLPFICRI